MTRKHYQAIAAAVKLSGEHLKGANHPEVVQATLETTAYLLADACRVYNSSFDRARFLTACGFPPKQF